MSVDDEDEPVVPVFGAFQSLPFEVDDVDDEATGAEAAVAEDAAGTREAPEAAAAAAAGAQGQATMQAAAPYGAPPLQVNRRPALDLSLPAAVNGGPAPMRSEGTDFDSPLDVPAFLRRQS